MKNGDRPIQPIVQDIKTYTDRFGEKHKELLYDTEGLSKREHFAIMAMQGLLANPEFAGLPFIDVAEHSAQAADSLLITLKAER